MNGKEIERQWIAEKGELFQELEEIPPSEMEQFYVAITREEEKRYRRERKANNGEWKHTLTVKKGNGMTRDEDEIPVTDEEYRRALDTLKIGNSHVIKKKRTTWRINGFRYEVDEFEEPSFDKIVVEIEFDDEEKARGFELMPDVVPAYFKNPVDVTEDDRWKMKNVALHGFPA